MRSRGHIRDEKVRQQVVIQIPLVRAHAEPAGMRRGVGQHIGERAVAVVPPEPVLAQKIIADVNVRPAVLIVVPPRRAETVAATGDARGLRHVGEFRHSACARAVVAKEKVRPSRRLIARPGFVVLPEGVVAFVLRLQAVVESLLHHRRASFVCCALRVFHAVRQQIHVEIAIAVVVREIC